MSDATLKAKSLSKSLSIIIEENHTITKKGGRADQILAKFEDLPSRSQLKSWFEQGRILRRGEALSADSKLFCGDELKIEVPPVEILDLDPIDLKLVLHFNDEHLAVVYKPKGISMHPSSTSHQEPTMVHGLLYLSKELSNLGGDFRPGIVHRLDKDTEGLVVIAKTNKAHAALSQLFSDRKVQKKYWALCYGKFARSKELKGSIGRHPVNRKKMAVVDKGRESFTLVRPLGFFEPGYTWVECDLKTGRTHQIRVHLSHEGHPLLGDPLYGRSRNLQWNQEQQKALEEMQSLALVAFSLSFVHPFTQEALSFNIEAPSWMKTLTKTLN